MSVIVIVLIVLLSAGLLLVVGLFLVADMLDNEFPND